MLALKPSLKYYLVVLSSMENISIKLESSIARQIEKKMAELNYTNKTEFIRDAIRGKLSELDEEAAKKKGWDALFALRGAFKGGGKATTDDEFRKIREAVAEEFFKGFEQKPVQKKTTSSGFEISAISRK